jgi:hypothetical protein
MVYSSAYGAAYINIYMTLSTRSIRNVEVYQNYSENNNSYSLLAHFWSNLEVFYVLASLYLWKIYLLALFSIKYVSQNISFTLGWFSENSNLIINHSFIPKTSLIIIQVAKQLFI